jgi:hypothetical protein
LRCRADLSLVQLAQSIESRKAIAVWLQSNCRAFICTSSRATRRDADGLACIEPALERY